MYLDTAAEALEVLKHGGFRVTHEAEEPIHFDNTYADLKRDSVLLRLSRERSHHSLELTSKRDKTEWYEADLILRLLGIRELVPYRGDGQSVADRARHLVRVIDQVDDAFSRKNWSETKTRLRELQQQRFQERMGQG